jgi:hypothetical protein
MLFPDLPIEGLCHVQVLLKGRQSLLGPENRRTDRQGHRHPAAGLGLPATWRGRRASAQDRDSLKPFDIYAVDGESEFARSASTRRSSVTMPIAAVATTALDHHRLYVSSSVVASETASLIAFNKSTLMTFRAGFASIIMGSFVKGLTP